MSSCIGYGETLLGPIVLVACSEFHDGPSCNFPMCERIAGIIDLVKRVASRDELVEGQSAFLEPPHEHGEVPVRSTGAAWGTAKNFSDK
jgi:hypothetical protein